MLQNGEPVFAQYYDRHEVHIPIHREAQMDAHLLGDVELWKAIESHVHHHVLQAQFVAQTMAAMAGANADLMPQMPLEEQELGEEPGSEPMPTRERGAPVDEQEAGQ